MLVPIQSNTGFSGISSVTNVTLSYPPCFSNILVGIIGTSHHIYSSGYLPRRVVFNIEQQIQTAVTRVGQIHSTKGMNAFCLNFEARQHGAPVGAQRVGFSSLVILQQRSINEIPKRWQRHIPMIPNTNQEKRGGQERVYIYQYQAYERDNSV